MSDSNQFFSLFLGPNSQSYHFQEQEIQIGRMQVDVDSNLPQYQQSQSQKSKYTRKAKRKIIQKSKRRKKIQQFEVERFQNTPKGRNGRKNNTQIQKKHLIQNQSYNDIIYHYCRFIYFATYLTKTKSSKSILYQQTYQSQWMNNISFVMSIDNYPSLSEQKPNFLLHSNTPHFLFQYLLKTQRKYIYTSTQMRDIILLTLIKRSFSSQVINNYFLPYWRDIITLINNTEQRSQSNLQRQTHRQNADDFQTQCKSHKGKSEPVSPQFLASKTEKQKTERESLKDEIQMDESIIAYQIACYLHSCCEKYSITITQ